jgi:hypothetical protein
MKNQLFFLVSLFVFTSASFAQNNTRPQWSEATFAFNDSLNFDTVVKSQAEKIAEMFLSEDLYSEVDYASADNMVLKKSSTVCSLAGSNGGRLQINSDSQNYNIVCRSSVESDQSLFTVNSQLFLSPTAEGLEMQARTGAKNPTEYRLGINGCRGGLTLINAENQMRVHQKYNLSCGRD